VASRTFNRLHYRRVVRCSYYMVDDAMTDDKPTGGLTKEQIAIAFGRKVPRNSTDVIAGAYAIEAIVRKDERERACNRIDNLWPVAKGLARMARDAILRDVEPDDRDACDRGDA